MISLIRILLSSFFSGVGEIKSRGEMRERGRNEVSEWRNEGSGEERGKTICHKSIILSFNIYTKRTF